VINLLYTTSEHGRYFQEIGQSVGPGESVSPRNRPRRLSRGRLYSLPD
jgi:hypothetical protein